MVYEVACPLLLLDHWFPIKKNHDSPPSLQTLDVRFGPPSSGLAAMASPPPFLLDRIKTQTLIDPAL